MGARRWPKCLRGRCIPWHVPKPPRASGAGSHTPSPGASIDPMHTLQLANAAKILSSELFYQYPEIVALERALERMGCLAPVPFNGGAVGCRLATEKGRLLLAALQCAQIQRAPSTLEAEMLGEFERAVANRPLPVGG